MGCATCPLHRFGGWLISVQLAQGGDVLTVSYMQWLCIIFSSITNNYQYRRSVLNRKQNKSSTRLVRVYLEWIMETTKTRQQLILTFAVKLSSIRKTFAKRSSEFPCSLSALRRCPRCDSILRDKQKRSLRAAVKLNSNSFPRDKLVPDSLCTASVAWPFG